MLLGQVESKLSQQFQTAFPKKFRDELGNRIIITKGIDKCLLAVSEQNWETLLEGTREMPFLDKATRELQRYLFGSADVIKIDKQGRFFMPEYLRVYANMSREIVFVGVQRYVEIWDLNLWESHQKSIANSIELLTINLSKTKGHE